MGQCYRKCCNRIGGTKRMKVIIKHKKSWYNNRNKSYEYVFIKDKRKAQIFDLDDYNNFNGIIEDLIMDGCLPLTIERVE
jgi:hypothetical protein